MKNTIILEDAKYIWTSAEIAEYKELEEKGYTATQIADAMGEKALDVVLLGLHLHSKKRGRG